jgi:hypothetical protein
VDPRSTGASGSGTHGDGEVMARYDVSITITMSYSMAIEADDPMSAQMLAFTQMPDKSPEKMQTEVEIERGNP